MKFYTLDICRLESKIRAMVLPYKVATLLVLLQ